MKLHPEDGWFMLMRPIYRNSKLNLCVVTSDPLNVKLPSVTLTPDLNRCSLSVSLVLPRLLQSKCVFSRSQGGMFNIQAKNVQHPMFNIWALSKVKESKHMHLGHVGQAIARNVRQKKSWKDKKVFLAVARLFACKSQCVLISVWILVKPSMFLTQFSSSSSSSSPSPPPPSICAAQPANRCAHHRSCDPR